MVKSKFTLLFLLPLLLLQGCATAVITGAAAGASVAYDRRTTGTIIDDQGIELKAANALYQDKEIYDQSHINVTSYNGTVLLSGETLTEELKQKVYDRVRTIPKVRSIHNELLIAAPSGIPSRSSDTWITSKVLAKLTAKEGVDPLYIKVVTENGTVYLMGLVTRAEAANAVSVASRAAGVQRVVKIFEYLD